MAREAQVHEPLTVEAAGGVFEQSDTALVNSDQVVVGAENGCYPALHIKFRKKYFQFALCRDPDVGARSVARVREHLS
ncbi:MAG: hypothetical protein IPK20_08075 [Betaproteobacteria bacterium]|nr:hypothetical protein [Betaproteobacteria bacterium]